MPVLSWLSFLRAFSLSSRMVTLAAFFLLGFAPPAFADDAHGATDTHEAHEVITLVSGRKVEGTILSDDANVGVTVRLTDGTTHVYKKKYVKQIEHVAPDPPSFEVHAAAEPPPAVPVVVPPPAPLLPASHQERRTIKALWITGLAVELGVWAIRAGITVAICGSYSGDQKGCNGTDYASAAIPVVGAWVEIGNGANSYAGPLALAGVLEAAGFATLVTGLAVRRDVVVYDTPQVSLSAFPLALPRGGGLGVGGRF